jgi:hypothetical protein
VAVLWTAPIHAQPTPELAERIVSGAYQMVADRSALGSAGFSVSVSAYQHLSSAQLQNAPLMSLIELPTDRYVDGYFMGIATNDGGAGRISYYPELVVPDTPLDWSRSAFIADTFGNALTIESATDPVWLDVVGATTYTVSLSIEKTSLTYRAAAFWLPRSGEPGEENGKGGDAGEEYAVRIVDHFLLDLTSVATLGPVDPVPPGPSPSPPPGPPGEQCIAETRPSPPPHFWEEHDSPPAIDADHTPWDSIGQHIFEASAGSQCSCDAGCSNRCVPEFTSYECRDTVPFSPGGLHHILYPFHVKVSSGHAGFPEDNHLQGGKCKFGARCAFRGCQVPLCAFTVIVQVAPEGVGLKLSPNENVVWTSDEFATPRVSTCPPCRRLLTFGGSVQGQFPTDGQLTLKLESPQSGVNHQQTFTSTGSFIFTPRIHEFTTYTVDKASETCVSCNLSGPLSGLATGHVNDILASCQPAACSQVGFHLSFHTAGGAPAGSGGQVLVLLETDSGSQNMNVSEAGTYLFPIPLNAGTLWAMGAQPFPPLQSCSISNGQGQAGSGSAYADITCIVEEGPQEGFLISGTIQYFGEYNPNFIVSLDAGQITLSPVATLNLGSSRNFSFAEPVPDGHLYLVSALSDLVEVQCLTRTGQIQGSNEFVTLNCRDIPMGPPPEEPPPFDVIGPPQLPETCFSVCLPQPVPCYLPCPDDPNQTCLQYCDECDVRCSKPLSTGQAVYGPDLSIRVP